MADCNPTMTLAQARDLSHTSDDESSEHSPRSVRTLSGGAGGGSTTSSKPRRSSGAGDFSSTVEHSKKPRGRPPGSKNKPKPPIVITKDSDFAMKPVVLEIKAGCDVVDTIVQFARKRRVGITVLSGSGSISTVTLQHSISHAPAVFTLQGPFSLVSLSGTFLGTFSSPSTAMVSSSPSGSKPLSSSSPPPSSCSSFGICLAGGQGHVFGGIVGGKIVAASLVVVVAATFLNPTLYKIPTEQDREGDEEVKTSIAGAGVVAVNDGSVGSTAMSVSVYGVASPAPINCQLSPDVMPWGPNSRPPY
ncbi:AT-hook motif nuclear-localized protein 28-like [Humulus lupulus]|uniref:AT-hook motif nuclear-localized protein 28-like n=1 Tax=Humulus lupulus TaxID=3486 RepID=UPI002B40298E|nr:AT-hook motif nuclear-localized protein 28-like [Humulus lupulus]